MNEYIRDYDKYIQSGRWRCSKSPTGAHHWVQITTTVSMARSGYFQCKYCEEVKKFPISYDAALTATYGSKAPNISFVENPTKREIVYSRRPPRLG